MILDFGVSEDFLSGFTACHPVEYLSCAHSGGVHKKKAVSKEYPVINTMFFMFCEISFYFAKYVILFGK